MQRLKYSKLVKNVKTFTDEKQEQKVKGERMYLPIKYPWYFVEFLKEVFRIDFHMRGSGQLLVSQLF